MKKLLAYLLSFLLMIQPVWVFGADYYMRADGTAANKAAATGPGTNAAACMSLATHNAESFSAGDNMKLCDDGGDIIGTLIPPSDGSSGSLITYLPESGDTPVIDANGGVNAVNLAPRDYVKISGITITGGTTSAVEIGELAGNNPSGIVVDNCSIGDAAIGIRILGSATDCELTDNTITGSTGTAGILIGYAVPFTHTNCNYSGNTCSGGAQAGIWTDSITFSGCIFDRNTCHSNTTHGIRFYNGTTGITATSCPSYNNGNNGFMVDQNSSAIINSSSSTYNGEDGFHVVSSSTMICSRDYAGYNGTPGSYATGDGFTNHVGTTLEMYYCRSEYNLRTGVGVGPNATAGTSKIYSCSFFNNGTDTDTDRDADIWLNCASGSVWDIRNNICSGSTYAVRFENDIAANLTIDYNSYDTSQMWKYNGTDYAASDVGFNNWKTAIAASTGDDANSARQDPKYTNASGGDLTLQSDSPCIDKGDYTLLSPNSKDYNGHYVTDENGNFCGFGSNVDTGAYEYDPDKNNVMGGTN